MHTSTKLFFALCVVCCALIPSSLNAQSVNEEDVVSLEFDEIELRQAIQFILRGRSDIRYVTGELMTEKVTVKFTNVEWRLAMDSLLKAHGYAAVEEGNILRVVRMEKKSEGTRRIPLVFQLEHTEPGALRQFIQPLLSPDGKILLLGSGAGERRLFAVVDTPDVQQTVRDLLPSIDLPSDQARSVLTKNTDGTVDIELVEFPLTGLAALLSRELELNVHVSGALAGRGNISLKKVKWEHALSLVLKDHGFIFRQESGVILITSIEASRGELETQEFRLRFIDAFDLKPYLTTLLSADGKISCYSPKPMGGYEFGDDITQQRQRTEDVPSALRSRVITVTDRPDVLSVISERIRNLDVRPEQIEIDVKIIQITRDNHVQMGIDWSTILSFDGAVRPHSLPWGPHSGKFTPAFPDTAAGFTFGSLAADELTAVLRLVNEDEDAEIVSEPNITTLDNIEAKILVGQKFPVLRETIDPQTAVRTVTLDYYQDIGIQLSVVPSISEGNRVHMIIHPAVSSLGELVEDRYPIINTREADTQLLLHSGETAVIGGLVEKTREGTLSKVPLLGDIPILNWFFSYEDTNDVTTELVILVTPRIILEPNEIQKSLLIGTQRFKVLNELRPLFEEILAE